MFFKDPSGNNLEFKAMTTPSNLFAKYNVDSIEINTATGHETNNVIVGRADGDL